MGSLFFIKGCFKTSQESKDTVTDTFNNPQEIGGGEVSVTSLLIKKA